MANLYAAKATRVQLRGAVALPPQLVVPKAWFDATTNFTGASWQSRVGGYSVQQPATAKQFDLIDKGLRVIPNTFMEITAPFDITATAAFTVLFKFFTINPEGITAGTTYFSATCNGDPGATYSAYTFNNSLEAQYYSSQGPRQSLNSSPGIAPNSSAWASADFAAGRTNASRIFLNNAQPSNYPFSGAVAGVMDQLNLSIGNPNPDATGVYALRHVLVFDQLLTGLERQNWMDYLG